MYRRIQRIKPRHFKLLALAALYLFCLISIHSSFLMENEQNFVENLKNIRHGKFSKPAQVKTPCSDCINIGMIIINLQKTDKLDKKFKASLEKTFNSIFKFSFGMLSIGNISTFSYKLSRWRTSGHSWDRFMILMGKT